MWLKLSPNAQGFPPATPGFLHQGKLTGRVRSLAYAVVVTLLVAKLNRIKNSKIIGLLWKPFY